MTTCALYLRQSKDFTGEAKAVDRQRDACVQHARSRGWTVVAEYVDNDVSASTRRPRPAFERLLEDAKSGRFEIALAWQLDRLTRKVTEIERIIEVSEATSVKFATASGDLDLTSDQGRLLGRILASVAKGEVERKSTRQHLADRQRIAEGKLPSARSFGYVGDQLEPVEADALRAAYAALLAGESLVSITKSLARQGFVGKKGQPFDRGVVRGILQNPKNAGLRDLNREGKVVGDGDWPKIVERDVFDAAVALLDNPARRVHLRGTTRRWVGSGLYLCGKCGSDVKVAASGAAGQGRHGYRCRAALHLTRTTGEQIDEFAEAAVARRLGEADAADLLPDRNGAAVAALRTDLAALTRREDQVAEDRADGIMTKRQVGVANERIAARRVEVVAKLAALTSESALGTVLSAPDPGAAFLGASVTVRQKVIDALAVVTLLPTKPGVRGFDSASVRIDWRRAPGAADAAVTPGRKIS